MKKITLSIATSLLLTFSACGTGPELTPAQQKELRTFDDVSQIAQLGEDLHKAMNSDELLFYAPDSMEKAKEYYEEAQEADTKDAKLAAYLAGKNALADGYETKKLVTKYLADVADIDQRMQKQNTKNIFPDRYQDFRDDYADLIKMIDDGETSDALDEKKEVMIEAKDLYGDAVVYRNINKAKIILDNLEDDDLDDLIPQHYNKARELYESSRLRIKKEPDNHQLIEELSRQTNEAALYAQTLAKDIKNFRALSKDEQEGYFARLHEKLAKLNPDEKHNAILPYPLYEKIDILRDMYKSSSYNAPQPKQKN
jgi:hypothetical protein